MRRVKIETTQMARLSLAAGVLALSACSFAPLPQLPAPKSAPGYAVQPPPAQSASADGVAQRFSLGARPVPAWWRQYGSDTLDAWVDEGLQHNASLEATRHSLAAARQLLRARTGQNELPSLDAAAQANRQRAVGLPELGPPTNLYDIYAGQLQLSYTFDLFGATRHGNAQARAEVDQQSYEFDAAKRALAANIVIAAIDAASLAEQVEISERLSALAHEQARLTEQSYQLGAAAHGDVLLARQNAASIDASLAPLRTQALRARHALAVLMGRTPDQAPSSLALAQLHLPAEVPVSVPSALLKQRPDVLAAEAAVQAASARVGVATAQLFPQISLSASTGSAAFKAASLFTGSAAIWGAGVSIAQPIFHGGALIAQRKAAVEDYQASLAQYRQTALNAFQNVADTLTALDQDASALQAAQAGAASAQQSYTDAEARYRLGAASYPSMLAGELRWQNARLGETQSRAARLTDTAALFQAMGAPLDEPAQAARPDAPP